MKVSWRSGALTCLLVVFSFLAQSTVMGEDDAVDHYVDQGADDEEYVDNIEHLVIATFSFLCAIFLSFFGMNLVYFSCLEDRLMRRFKDEGVKVRATVHSTDFLRQTHNLQGLLSSGQSRKSSEFGHEEYLAAIEYKCTDSSSCRCLVRKQVKAYGSDFAKSDVPGAVVKVLTLDEDLSVAPTPSPIPMKLTVLVLLPDHVNSGLSKNHVDRACRLIYRLPTFFMFVFLLAVTTFFLVVGCIGIHRSLPSRSDDEEPALPSWSVAKWTAVILATMLSFEAAFTHYCLRRPIAEVLEEEYLNGGDCVLSSGDSSSISSGDDSYLLMPSESGVSA